ncbi:MAG: translocase [Rhodospirillales bacterium]|nr:translocase [Rhodospirillales bacterium]
MKLPSALVLRGFDTDIRCRIVQPTYLQRKAMNEDGSVIGILIFAGIAVFLVFRLRAVLGRRTGEEREQSNPFDRPPIVPFQSGVGEPPVAFGGREPVTIDNDPTLPLSLDAKLARVHAGDPAFDEKHFLAGARSAFQMIVSAFAAGDLATLRPLLSSNLYGEFGRAISERPHRDAGEAIHFEGQVEAEIVDARVNGREVFIQVRFVSRQVHPGETAAPDEDTIDLWSFSRDLGSRDPNWQLVETATEH